jgi:hypothetical protein
MKNKAMGSAWMHTIPAVLTARPPGGAAHSELAARARVHPVRDARLDSFAQVVQQLRAVGSAFPASWSFSQILCPIGMDAI